MDRRTAELARTAGYLVTDRTTEDDLKRAVCAKGLFLVRTPFIHEERLADALGLVNMTVSEIRRIASRPISPERREDILIEHRRVKAATADPMWFFPYDGFCWSCRQDVVDEGVERGDLTGCPKCQRSWCD